MTQDDPMAAMRKAGRDAAEGIEAALGPLRRVSNATAQIAYAKIPADAACHCVCSLYREHRCEGWARAGVFREVVQQKICGWLPPPLRVPLCGGCAQVELRES